MAALFSHPLASFLSARPPFQELREAEYHKTHDFVDFEGHLSRSHRFLTGREAGGTKPIWGLTAYVPPRAILIEKLIKAVSYASVGY